MDKKILIDNIQKHVDSLNLKSKAFSLIDKIKKGYEVEKETIDGYKIDELIFKFERQEIILETEFKVTYINTRIGIFISDPDKIWINNLKPIGYFDYEVDFNGEYMDDYFVLK